MHLASTPARALLASLLLGVGLAPAAPASAQTRLVIHAGASVARLDGAGDDTGSRTGIHVGGGADLPLLLGGKLSVVPGGQFIEKGFSLDDDAFDLRLYYIEAIAPVKLTVPLGGRLGVSAFAGPGVALGFGCTETIREGGIESTRDCSPDEFGIKGWDLVGLAGAGLVVRVTSQASLLLNGVYDTSLTSVSTSTVPEDLHHRAWLIQAGVSFLPVP